MTEECLSGRKSNYHIFAPFTKITKRLSELQQRELPSIEKYIAKTEQFYEQVLRIRYNVNVFEMGGKVKSLGSALRMSFGLFTFCKPKISNEF